MRILQLTNKPPWPDKDGGAIATLNLVKGFALLGHEVTVLSMNTLKHHTRITDIPEPVLKMADFRVAVVPAKISPGKALLNLLFSKQPYNAVRFISGTFEKELIKLLRQKKFDIIQLEGLYLCPYIPAVRRNSPALIAYRAHNIEAEIWRGSAVIAKGIKRWYLLNLASRIEKFEKNWLNSYDLLVPITRRDAEKLNSMGNKKPFHVSSAGIDFEIIRKYSGIAEFPSLFHIGSLEWPPNQEGILWFLGQVWETLSARYPALRFYIAGRNAPQWLRSRLKKPGIVFLGEVDDAYEFMSSKSVMVVPLLSGSGMRIKIIEGMALGKTIVSTPVGAEGLNVSHGQNIMIADGPEEFIRYLELLVENKTVCDLIGERAALFVRKNFDNLAIADKLAGFYSENSK